MHRTASPSSEVLCPRKTPDITVLRLNILWAVTLVVFLSAAKAEASCGYYVTSTNPGVEMKVDHPSAKRSTGGSCPCNGPQCESNQSNQTTPLPSTTSSTFDAAPIAADRLPASQTSGVAQVEDSAFLSDPHRLLLDPPPR